MSKTLLIVDDEPPIRILLKQTLEKLEEEGVEILLAENGEVALEIVRRTKPDLVFLDVNMPVMDGLTLCRIIKHELKLKNTYIFMLTAEGQDFQRQEGLNAGADCYMTKPFNPDEVLAKATELLAL